MLLSHSGEYGGEYENLKFPAKFAENDKIGLEKYWKKWGLMNACEFLTKFLQIFRILANA